jgi:hypothetical protein
MPLIDWPDCGKQVSSRAPACVNCGAPIAGALPYTDHEVAVMQATAEAPRRVSYTDQQVAVMLSRKKRTSHVLHFLFSLFTLGLWVPIWILVAISNGTENATIEKRIRKGRKVR